MEVTILQARGIDADSVVSIRAGRTRRQAPITHKRPFRFPSLALNASPVTIDVMTPLASVQLDAASAAEIHSVLFPTEPGKKPMSMTLRVKDAPGMCSSPDNVQRLMNSMSPAGTTSRAGAMSVCSDLPPRASSAMGDFAAPRDCPSSASMNEAAAGTSTHVFDSGSAVIAARNYLEQSNVLGFMQELLKYVVREMPEDPISFMAAHLISQHKTAIAPAADQDENLRCSPKAIDTKLLSSLPSFDVSALSSPKLPPPMEDETTKAQSADLESWLAEESKRLRGEIERLQSVINDEGINGIVPRQPRAPSPEIQDIEQLKAEHTQMNRILIALCEDAIQFATKLLHQDDPAPAQVSMPKREKLQKIATNRGLHDGADDELSEEELEEAPLSFLRPRHNAVSAEACGAWNQRLTSAESEQFHKSPEDTSTIRAALKASPIFAHLGDEALEPVVDAMPLASYEASQHIWRQADMGDELLVIMSGTVGCYSDVGARKILVNNIGPGRIVGELAMLWRTPRALSVVTREKCVCARLPRKVYQDFVVRHEVDAFENRVRCLRNTEILENLPDEQIAVLADIVELLVFQPGETIMYQGDVGTNFFVLLSGECKATVTSGHADYQDVQEHRRYYDGDFFGERALLLDNPIRAASISAVSRSEVLCLSRSRFERLIGPFNQLRAQNYPADPRASIAAFYRPGNEIGPAGAGGDPEKGRRTDWFAVYRPTSREAIAKMLSGRAVGKGLNVKGKSARVNRLAGFVPFLQISENHHKSMLEIPPGDTFIDIYWSSKAARRHCQIELQAMLDQPNPDLDAEDMQDLVLGELNQYKDVFGFRLPEAVVHKAFIEQPDLTFPVGWETGRLSEPAFMEMNLHVLRNEHTVPRVVLYQANLENPMCPHGLLMSYAEATVKPTVSDFDTFIVGSRGMMYETLPPSQVELARWMLQRTKQIFETPDRHSWTTRWLDVMKSAVQEGRHWEVPTNGFGDSTSIRLIEAAMEATQEFGAVRHGAECFNFIFPQELDTEYLVVWDGFEESEGKPWDYLDEEDLRAFLVQRVNDGFSFPLNPVWLVRDPGWYEVLEALQANEETAGVLSAWFPPESGMMEQIQAVHEEFPEGFMRAQPDGVGRSRSVFNDLQGAEKADLALESIRRTALLHRFRHASKALTGLGICRKVSQGLVARGLSPLPSISNPPSPRKSVEPPGGTEEIITEQEENAGIPADRTHRASTDHTITEEDRLAGQDDDAEENLAFKADRSLVLDNVPILDAPVSPTPSDL